MKHLELPVVASGPLMPRTTTKYTSGPWSAHGCAVYQNDCWNAGHNEGGRYIGSTYYGSPEEESDDMPTATQNANAVLMAAAPELLEACKLILKRGYVLDASDSALLADAITKAENL